MLRALLFPLSILYGIVVYIRNKLFDFGLLKSQEFDIPVISVGNITVGGTGKTPHVEYLVGLLNKHFQVATLSRGYKRKTAGFVLGDEKSTCNDIGDEPKQILRKYPEIKVAVMADRVAGINKLTQMFKDLEVIFLDDAYQHRYVKPGLSILLLDYNRPIHSDSLLPLGRLRERPHQMKRANIIIVTKAPKDLKPIERRIIYKNLNLFPYQSLYFTTIDYKDLKPVFYSEINTSHVLDEGIHFDDVLLITGIANPQYLHAFLKKRTQNIEHLRFPDHHNFVKKDIDLIVKKIKEMKSENKIIITTEKDSMRLSEINFDEEIKRYMFYIPMEIVFIHNDREDFNKQIINYVKSNKRNF